MAVPKGVRIGGRKAGTPNKATADVKVLARKYTGPALRELGRLATSAESEQARVSAIGMLLDRGYGKATQLVAGDPNGSPIKSEITVRFVKPKE